MYLDVTVHDFSICAERNLTAAPDHATGHNCLIVYPCEGLGGLVCGDHLFGHGDLRDLRVLEENYGELWKLLPYC
jgi:uncharacterized protein (DUF1501 family)